MKKKEKIDLRKKTIDELAKNLSDKKFELFTVQINRKAGKEKNLKKVKLLRREIAQISTIIREGQLTKGGSEGNKQ